jgi:hypothetical protein
MRKLLLYLFCNCPLLVVAATMPIDSLLLGGSGTASHETQTTPFGNSSQSIKSINLESSILCGLFFTSKLAGGLELSYQRLMSENTTANLQSTTEAIWLRPFVRWYFMPQLFVQPSVGYGMGRTDMDVDFGISPVSVITRRNSYSMGIRLGYDIRLSPTFWFEPALSYNYLSSKYDANDKKSTSNQFQILIGFVGIVPVKSKHR